MKSFCITILIAMFFLISIKETYAQTTQTQLIQVELMKQFIGTWECELGKRTIYRSDNKQFGTGMACIIQVISNGEIVDSVEQLFGYDASTDKFVLAELIKSSSIVEISSAWFTSEHKGEIVTTHPDSEKRKFNFEFITPDLLKETATLDNNIVVEMEFNRVK
ncbi:MAG: hypothetical protein Q8N83_16895 [Ignavibacteria bacterium]|nr:hypothetical protein [Ignavibacteria bacterium]